MHTSLNIHQSTVFFSIAWENTLYVEKICSIHWTLPRFVDTPSTAWNIRARGRERSEKTKKTHSTKWSLFFSRLVELPSYFARSSSLDLSECPFRCQNRPLTNRRNLVKHCGYTLTKRNAVCIRLFLPSFPFWSA